MQVFTSLILILPFLECIDSRSVTTYAAVVGDSITLYCPERSKNSVTWHGPHNYFPYSEDDEINPLLTSKHISIVGNSSEGEFNLKIYNISYSNQGHYKCRALSGVPMEFDILLIITDKPSTVEAITDNATLIETHTETNYHVSAFKSTRAQNEYAFNNLNVSCWNKVCTKDNNNEIQIIILCISSFIVVIVTVTFLGVVLSKYYKTKCKGQIIAEVDDTNDYEEIESTNSDLMRGAQMTINPRIAINIPETRKEDEHDEIRSSDTNIDEGNALNCLAQSLNADSLYTAQKQYVKDFTTVYENDTLTGNTDDDDPDDYLNPYVELGPEDYLNSYQQLRYNQS